MQTWHYLRLEKALWEKLNPISNDVVQLALPEIRKLCCPKIEFVKRVYYVSDQFIAVQNIQFFYKVRHNDDATLRSFFGNLPRYNLPL